MRIRFAVAILAAFVVTGCSGGAKPSTCKLLYVGGADGGFFTELASPVPNAGAVPDDITTLILIRPAYPIKLNILGPAPLNATPIPTTPTALPSPFPASLGSPDPNLYFAVTVPPLRAATSYEAGTYSDINGCEGQYSFASFGLFTTQ